MNIKHLSIFLIVLLCIPIVLADDDIDAFKEGFQEAIKNPKVSKMVGNERINVYIDDSFEWHIVTENNEITSIGEDKLEDPTLNVYVKKKESKALTEGKIDFLDAVDQGIIKLRGVGFLRGFKFGAVSFISKTFSFFRGVFNNKCKGVTCSASSTTCPDGSMAACENKCNKATGECSNCTPECTVKDLGDPVPNCDDANPCTIDSYNDATSQCEHTVQDCNDQDACTTDRCDSRAGGCVHTQKACDDQDPRTQDSCDQGTGACVHQLPGSTILEGTLVTNTNQMGTVVRLIFTEVNNQANTHESTIVLDSGGQLKNFVLDVGFGITPDTQYEVTYEWVSGAKASLVSSVIEGISVIGASDAITLGDGTRATRTSVTVTFTTAVRSIEPDTNTGDNEMRGTSADDTLNAGAGSDSIYGLAGNDIIYGDSEDVIIDGGLGIDTLVSYDVDLSVVYNIEIIELESILHDLSLDAATVIALGASNTAATISSSYQLDLLVKGNGDVSLDSDWVNIGNMTYDSLSYNVWENTVGTSDAVLATEQSMSVEISD